MFSASSQLSRDGELSVAPRLRGATLNPANFRQLRLNSAGAEIDGIRQNLVEIGGIWRKYAEFGGIRWNLAELGGIRQNFCGISGVKCCTPPL